MKLGHVSPGLCEEHVQFPAQFRLHSEVPPVFNEEPLREGVWRSGDEAPGNLSLY
jgi:hypothetical protein